jgi:hypothetical protein
MAVKKPLKKKPTPKTRDKIGGTGRPPKYDPDFHPEWARKFALLGAKGTEIADSLEIPHRTFETWKTKYPEFRQSIIDGGEKADAQVADKLHQRALGYTCTVEQAFKVKKGKDVEVVEVVTLKQEQPPDTKAATMWLSNRQRGRWKDRQTQEHDVSDDLAEILRKGRERHNAFLEELEEEKKRRGDA